jgi:hypothetical protein
MERFWSLWNDYNAARWALVSEYWWLIAAFIGAILVVAAVLWIRERR